MMKSKPKSKSKLQITNDQLPITNGKPPIPTPYAQPASRSTLHAPSPLYSLRRGLGVWELTFAGKKALLKHEQGLYFVAHLLLNPPSEPIHGLALALRATAIYRKITGTAEITDPLSGQSVAIPVDAQLQEHDLRFDAAEEAWAIRREQRHLEA